MPLSDDDVREILRLIDESDLAELHVQTEGLLVHVVRDGSASPALPGIETESESEAARPNDEARGPEAGHPITAPLLGTFYRAAAPGATPYVEVGARVEEDTVVCLIEVMKMMNAVPAGVAGTITEVCAANAELVEAGDPLFLVRLDP
jgi:acetyl-CoA carboxylase biotin carboxyl carrier protein